MYKVVMIRENPVYETLNMLKSIPGNPLASELQGYGVNICIVPKKSRNKISYITNYKKTYYENAGCPLLNEMPKLDLLIKGKEENVEGYILFVECDSVPTTSGELISSSYCNRKEIILLKEGQSIIFQKNEKKQIKVKVKKGKLHIK